MKRAGGLWQEIVSYENLFAAAKAAAMGKRKRPDVARLLLDLENEIVMLRHELMGEEYRPGPYRTFLVHEPKARMISAAPFRDRVVHHALTRVLEPVFERRFSAHSFACRRDYGTHRAIRAAHRACRRYRFVLKCDVRKYFASIDHEILKSLLARAVKCGQTLNLAARIIDGSNAQEPVCLYFPGDDLFTPFERRRGLPLGNQTSQFFANVYLNALDHFIERKLQPAFYARYVDDFVLFGNDKCALGEMLGTIVDFLSRYRLKIHPGKSRVYRTADGVTFLGWRLFPDRMRLVRPNVIRFRRRLRRMQAGYSTGELDWDTIDPSVRAWIAHADHGDTWRLRENILGEAVFRRGNAAGAAGRFLEQQIQELPRIQPQQEQPR